MGLFSLPLTNAGSVVLGKSRRTFTCEATNGVNTQELAVVLLSCTLIKIYKKMQDGIGVELTTQVQRSYP